MGWIPYAVMTALVLAMADFLIKLTSDKISPSLGLVLFGVAAFTVGISWVIWERTQGIELMVRDNGLWMGLAVGFAFSFVTVGLYTTFGAGAPVSQGSPMIRLGGLTLVSLAGLFLLQEHFTWRYAAGMLLALIGIYLIITRDF